jgi:hypothetical protein
LPNVVDEADAVAGAAIGADVEFENIPNGPIVLVFGTAVELVVVVVVALNDVVKGLLLESDPPNEKLIFAGCCPLGEMSEVDDFV